MHRALVVSKVSNVPFKGYAAVTNCCCVSVEAQAITNAMHAETNR